MKTIAVFTTDDVVGKDHYDSMRAEGRIPLNMGFGLADLGFTVHIIKNSWNNGLINIYKDAYLTNKPQLKYYDYALTFSKLPYSNSKYGTVIFMGYEPDDLKLYEKYKNEVSSNIVYTHPSFMAFEKHQLRMPFIIHYLPVLYPISVFRDDKKLGFFDYEYSPNLPNLNISMFYSTWSDGSNSNKKYLDKEILIINYLKSKGYILNINVLIESKEIVNLFPSEKFVNSNETQHKLHFTYSNECNYLDIIYYIRNSDICTTVGGFSSGNCIVDMISLGKPLLFIGDGIEEKNQIFTVSNGMYKCPEELLYLQEDDRTSLKKIEKFIENPKNFYDKFKDAHKDFSFDNWKKYALKFFSLNGEAEITENLPKKVESKIISKENLIKLINEKKGVSLTDIKNMVNQSFKYIKTDMEEEETCEIANEVIKLNPKIIVEIGVKHGGTLNIWRKLITYNGIVIGIDSDNDLSPLITQDTRVKFVHGDSLNLGTYKQFLSIIGDRKIDFLFIDGGHVYRETKSDFYTFGWNVRKGGIIAFHDIDLDSEGDTKGATKHFWNEVKERSGKYWKVIKESHLHTGTGFIEIL
jgi:hypothetical protein